MRRLATRLTIVAVALAACHVWAAAPERAEIARLEIGGSLSLVIPPGDSGKSMARCEFQLNEPGSVIVEAKSLELDVWLQVHEVDAEGGTILVGGDDDTGAGKNALFAFDGLPNRTYRVTAHPFAETWGGRVTIESRRGPYVPPDPAARERATTDYWAAANALAIDRNDPVLKARVEWAEIQTAGNLTTEQRRNRSAATLASIAAHAGEDSSVVAFYRKRIAHLTKEEGRLDEAHSIIEQSLSVLTNSPGEADPATAEVLDAFAWILQAQERFAEAEAMARRSLEAFTKSLGDQSDQTAVAANSLGVMLQSGGQLETARPLLEQALAINSRLFGPKSIGSNLNNLGLVARDSGDLSGALGLFERAISISESAQTKSNLNLINQLVNLAELHSKLGDEAKAVDVCRRIVTLTETEFGPDSRKLAVELNRLARHLRDAKDVRGAQAATERALAIWSKLGDPDDTELEISVWDASQIALQIDDYASARRHLERALAIKTRLHGAESSELVAVLSSLGHVLGTAGDLEGARTMYEHALGIANAHDDLNAAKCLDSLVAVARMQGRPDEARSFLARAIAKYEAAADQLPPGGTENVKEIADSLQDAARTLYLTFGDQNGAIELMRRVITLRERSLPSVDDALVVSLGQLGYWTTESGDAKSGTAIADRALKLAESGWGDNDIRTIRAVVASSYCLDAAGQQAKSRRQRTRVREFVKVATSPDAAWTEKQLEELASQLWADPGLGFPIYARIAAIHQAEGADNLSRALDEERQAIVDFSSGRQELAVRHFGRALELRRESPTPNAVSAAPTLNNLAVLRSISGEDDQARKLLEEALTLDSPGAPLPATVRQPILSNLGAVLRSLGRYPEARQLFEQYRRGVERENGSHSTHSALATLWIALTLSDEHDDAAAVAEFGKVLTVYERLGRSNDSEPLVALAGRAESNRRLGRAAAAEDDERGVLKTWASGRRWNFSMFGSVNSRMLSKSVVNISDLARVWRIGYSAAELRQGLDSVDEFDRAIGATTTFGTEMLVQLADAQWHSGRFRQAIETATKASLRLDDRTRALISVLPERQALRLARSQQHPESVFFTTLVEDRGPRSAALDAAWRWTLQHRALVLDELAQRHRVALGDESAEARAVRARLLEARRRLSILFLRYPLGTPDAEAANVLEDAQNQRDEADAALAAVSASYRASQRVRDASLREVAAALGPDSALVEICRVPVLTKEPTTTAERYIALILLGKQGKADFADLGPAAEIDALVAALQEGLHASFESANEQSAMSLDAFAAPGSRVREKIWDPIARKLGGAKLVFVVPDGALNQVNLSALPTSGARFVFDDGIDIHLLSTGRDLIRISESGSGDRRGSGVLALGAPDYDASNEGTSAALAAGAPESAYRGPRPGCESVTNHRWRPLPGSGEEAKVVANLVGAAEPEEILVSAAAGEEQLKRDAPGKRILHLATHAYFLRPDCEATPPSARGMSSLVPAPGAAATKAAIAETAPPTPDPEHAPIVSTDNPLLLSGLILAGANRAADAPADTDDGILTAEEIASMDLHGTELATLSACESGLGAVEAGDGVYGLRRALEIAGVRTVLMSLWPVPDRETPLWMEAFYRARMRGSSVVVAVREASGDALSRLRAAGQAPHPYYWASFQAAGDWRARPSEAHRR